MSGLCVAGAAHGTTWVLPATAGVDPLVTGSLVWLGTAGLAYACGLGDQQVLTSRRETRLRATVVGVLSGVLALAAGFPTPGRFAWLAAATLAVMVALSLSAWRSLFWLRERGGRRLRAVVVGTAAASTRLARLMHSAGGDQYEVMGFVTPEMGAGSGSGASLPHLGSVDALPGVCDRAGARLVVLASEVPARGAWLTVLARLRERGIRCRTAGSLSMEIARRVPADLVGSRWLVDRLERVDRLYGRYGKRFADVLTGSAGLLLFASVFPLLWIAVRLDSAGPFFFAQPRVGVGGRVFRLYKIRTMRSAQTEERWADARDDRVTRVGAVLRKLRIDEFPQFWNVLRGDMSVVGPRPEQPGIARDLEAKIPLFGIRHLVKPGITGWAQIHHGYASSVEDSRVKLAYDLYYVHHYSILLDLDIMLRTLFVMALGFRAR